MGPFDHMLLLCERDQYSVDEADARTLLTLMLVREATKGSAGAENILTELLEPNAVDLGGGDASSDFIVSQKLISLLMAQLSESPHLADVFADLFDSGGAHVALHPAERYVPLGTTTFGDIVAAARDWGVVADRLPGGRRPHRPAGDGGRSARQSDEGPAGVARGQRTP